jgi:hypothetical protein
LESVCRGNSTVGSNPTLSARFRRASPCSAREYAEGVAITSGLGAGIGLGLDALVRGRTRIYPTETRGFWKTVNLAPQVSRRRVAIVVSTRW